MTWVKGESQRKLTRADEIAIRRTRRPAAEVAARFGITPTHVYRLRSKEWELARRRTLYRKQMAAARRPAQKPEMSLVLQRFRVVIPSMKGAYAQRGTRVGRCSRENQQKVVGRWGTLEFAIEDARWEALRRPGVGVEVRRLRKEWPGGITSWQVVKRFRLDLEQGASDGGG